MADCDRCDRHFTSLQALEQHEDNSSRHNTCHDCHLDFPTSWGLVQHYVQSNSHDYCQRCQRHFDNDYNLVEHYRTVHYYCESCESVFDTAIGLDEHIKQTHEQLFWECRGCGRKFRTENSLDNHLQSSTHLPKDHPCPDGQCGTSFVSESARVLHFESGTCPSGVDRRQVDEVIEQIDPHDIISFWSHRDQRIIYRCPPEWNGCDRDFSKLSGLLQHVESGACDVEDFDHNMWHAMGSLVEGMERYLGI